MTSFITPHCISAYIICNTEEGARYLLIRRCGEYLKGTWQMVSGGTHPGETAPQTALREIFEETGITPRSLYSADIIETFYLKSSDKIAFVPVFVAFVDDMSVTLSLDEHDAYQWLPYEEAKELLAWPEQRRIISHIHQYCVLQKPSALLLINT